MKTILALTDFSAAADNAARFAFEMAKEIKANVILCNAIKIPLSQPIPVGAVWPIEDYDEIIRHFKLKLENYAETLTRINSLEGRKYPKVTVKSDLGAVTELLREAVLTSHINLSVMGLSGAGEMSRFFLGSSTRDVIDLAAGPVMLIPKHSKFSPFSTIAFATDLSLSDFQTIQSLAGLAEHFNADLLIVHVIDKNSGTTKPQEISNFMIQLKTSINYDKIYYRNVYSKDVEDGLESLSEHGHIDCLAMIHRPHDFFSSVLKGSHSQKMARLAELPLIVFPPDYKSVIC